jgi:hypothetical protein
VLKSDMGISHDAFREPSIAEDNLEEEGDLGDDNQEKNEKAEDDILKSYRHIYVKEVVREPRIHYYMVPRLGSFMAVPLIFNSCLFDEALDDAVNDY